MISNPNGKLRTYSILKTKIGFENYLKEIKNPKVRIACSKFRLSDHNLRIESGRYEDLDKYLRTRPFCKHFLEDEKHFLLKCPVYIFRKFLLTTAQEKEPRFRCFTDDEKWLYLMNKNHRETVLFIFNAQFNS